MPQCPKGTFHYTIGPGDTLWQIAQRYRTNVYAIAAINPGLDINNLNVGQVICIRPMNERYPQQPHFTNMGISKAEAALRNHLRLLWEQHVVWTTLTILSIVFDLPDVDLVTKRLLQNPIDFKMALKPLYGDRIASEFANLFTSHLTIADQLVKAAKAGNTQAVADAEKRWYANADEMK